MEPLGGALVLAYTGHCLCWTCDHLVVAMIGPEASTACVEGLEHTWGKLQLGLAGWVGQDLRNAGVE